MGAALDNLAGRFSVTELGDGSDEKDDDLSVEFIGGRAALPAPAPGPEASLQRENTARWLGKGIFGAFAGVILCLCITHVIALYHLSEPIPKGLTGADLEAWFRWREQLRDTVSGFAQTVGTFLAGPLGVVLGFYFRDQTSK